MTINRRVNACLYVLVDVTVCKYVDVLRRYYACVLFNVIKDV